MIEYYWQELVHHRHDIMIPIFIVCYIIFRYLDRWWFNNKIEQLYESIADLFEELRNAHIEREAQKAAALNI